MGPVGKERGGEGEGGREREGARGGSAAGQVRATATAVGGDRHGTSLAVGGVVDASCVARRDTAAGSSVGGGGSVEPPRDRRRRAHATAGGAANYNPSDLIWVDLQCVTPTFGWKMGRIVAENCLNVQQHLGSFIPPRPTSSANELCVLSLLQRDLALLVAAEVVHALLRHRDLDLAVAVEVYYALHLQSASVVLLWIVGHSDLWSRWPLSCPPRCWLLVPLGAAIVQPATPPPDPSCA